MMDKNHPLFVRYSQMFQDTWQLFKKYYEPVHGTKDEEDTYWENFMEEQGVLFLKYDKDVLIREFINVIADDMERRYKTSSSEKESKNTRMDKNHPLFAKYSQMFQDLWQLFKRYYGPKIETMEKDSYWKNIEKEKQTFSLKYGEIGISNKFVQVVVDDIKRKSNTTVATNEQESA